MNDTLKNLVTLSFARGYRTYLCIGVIGDHASTPGSGGSGVVILKIPN